MMPKRVLSSLFMIFLITDTSAYSKCKVIDCDNGFILQWDTNATHITASMEAKSSGYVAIGLSAGGSSPMLVSDIILGWVPDTMDYPLLNGKVRDYSTSTSYGQPTLDAQQDVTLISSTYNTATQTMRVEWARVLTPSALSSSEDHAVTPGTPQTLIWATNPNMGAVTSVDGSTFTKHLSNTRGSISSFDFGSASSCAGVCSNSPVRPVDLLYGECLGNGWPSNEAGGDRDNGNAWPKVRYLNPSTTPSATPSPSSTMSVGASTSPTPSPSAISTSSNVTGYPDAATSPILTSPDGNLAIAWSLTADRNNTIINIITKQKGWMGVAWNTANLGMKGADFAISWVSPKSGSGATTCTGLIECDVHLSDRTAGTGSGHSVPKLTETQDFTVLTASVTSTLASITFRRALRTGEAADVNLLPTSPLVYFIWAYGTAIGNSVDGTFSQHTSSTRGVFSGGPFNWTLLAAPGPIVDPSSSPTPSSSPSPTSSTSSTSSAQASLTPSITPSPGSSLSPTPSISATPSISTSPSPSPSSPAAGLVIGVDIPHVLPDANATAVLASSDGVLRASWSLSPSGSYSAINLVSRKKGWMSLGFNTGSDAVMTGMDAIVAWVAPRGAATTCDGAQDCQVYLSDRSSVGRSMPDIDPLVSTQQGTGLTLLDAYLTADIASVTFLRKVTPSTPATRSTTALVTNVDLSSSASVAPYLLWAYGEEIGDFATGAFSQHATEGKGYVAQRISWTGSAVDATTNMANTGASPLQIVSGGSLAGGKYALHGASMICGYWMLMMIASWVGRYRQSSPALMKISIGKGMNSGSSGSSSSSSSSSSGGSSSSSSALTRAFLCLRSFHSKQFWFLLHIYFHTAAILAITIGLIAIKSGAKHGDDNEEEGSESNSVLSVHEKAGIASLVGAYSQYTLGLIRPDLLNPWRSTWLKAHRIIAMFTFAAAFVAIPVGLNLSGLLYKPAVLMAVVVNILCSIGFTMFMEVEVKHGGNKWFLSMLEVLVDAVCITRKKRSLPLGTGAVDEVSSSSSSSSSSSPPSPPNKSSKSAFATRSVTRNGGSAVTTTTTTVTSVNPLSHVRSSHATMATVMSFFNETNKDTEATEGSLTTSDTIDVSFTSLTSSSNNGGRSNFLPVTTSGEHAVASAAGVTTASSSNDVITLDDDETEMSVSKQSSAADVSSSSSMKEKDVATAMTTTTTKASSQQPSSGFNAARTMLILSIAIAGIINSALMTYVMNATSGEIVTNLSPLFSGYPSANRTVTSDLNSTSSSSGVGGGASSRLLLRRRILQSSPLPVPPVNATYTYVNITDGKYPGGDQSLCFHFYNYSVPVASTSYTCRAFAFPPDVDLHAVEFVPLIDNPTVTHHLLLFGVTTDMSKTASVPFVTDSKGYFACSDMPPNTGPLFVWAVGAKSLTLPSNMGMRVGSGPGAAAAGGSVKYVVLQIHYSNPSGTPGVLDSSGVLVRVTNVTRPVEAGVLIAGAQVSNQMVIPPNKTAYGLSAQFNIGIPGMTPRTVFSVVYHAHTLGKRVWAETWRPAPGGGQYQRVLDPSTGVDILKREDNYDFGMQRFLPLQNATLQFNDTLRVRCVFENTIARGQLGGNTEAIAGRTVYGGEATYTEMCMSILYYAPRLSTTQLPSPFLLYPSAPFCDNTPGSPYPTCDSIV